MSDLDTVKDKSAEDILLAFKALQCIEIICMNEDPYEKNSILALIYKLAHAGGTPKCRNSHIEWEKNITSMHKDFSNDEKV